ncbi:MAG: hypothetical protein ACK5Q5_18090 [Planctomycetaceae bacterium]
MKPYQLPTGREIDIEGVYRDLTTMTDEMWVSPRQCIARWTSETYEDANAVLSLVFQCLLPERIQKVYTISNCRQRTAADILRTSSLRELVEVDAQLTSFRIRPDVPMDLLLQLEEYIASISPPAVEAIANLSGCSSDSMVGGVGVR